MNSELSCCRQAFLAETLGSNMVEYALIVAVIALVCIPALLGFSDAIGTFWDTISTRLLN